MANRDLDAKFAETNGLRLAYVEKGQGPLVLLLHGFPDTVKTWEHMIDALASSGFRAVAPHMRGWRPSDISEADDYSVRALANDALGLIAALGERQAFIIGHDWGSFAAYAAAVLAPDKVMGIVTSGLPPIRVYKSHSPRELAVRPHHMYLRWRDLSAALVKRHDFAEIDHLYHKWSPHLAASTAHMQAVKSALAEPGRARQAVDYYRKPMTKADKVEFSRRITVPGLVFYGSDEPEVRQEMFRKAPEAFVQPPRLVKLDKVGHWPHLEKPSEVEVETLGFLARNAS